MSIIPTADRFTRSTDELVTSKPELGGKVYTVRDRIFGEDKQLTIRPGGLGDNLILEGGGGFEFLLGLATIEAIVEDAGLRPGPKLTIEDEEERDERLSKELLDLPHGATWSGHPLSLDDTGSSIPSGEIAGTLVRDRRGPMDFHVPGGRGLGGKWWLSVHQVLGLGLLAPDFSAPPRPYWLTAEVIRAELEGEQVFAVRDCDDDWLVYGGAQDGDYVMESEAQSAFSNVEVVKA